MQVHFLVCKENAPKLFWVHNVLIIYSFRIVPNIQIRCIWVDPDIYSICALRQKISDHICQCGMNQLVISLAIIRCPNSDG